MIIHRVHDASHAKLVDMSRDAQEESMPSHEQHNPVSEELRTRRTPGFWSAVFNPPCAPGRNSLRHFAVSESCSYVFSGEECGYWLAVRYHAYSRELLPLLARPVTPSGDEWHLLETVQEPDVGLTWRLLARFDSQHLRKRLGAPSKSDVTCACITNNAQIFLGFRNGTIGALKLVYDSGKGKSDLVGLPALVLAGFQDPVSGGSITHLRILYNHTQRRMELLILRINGEMSLWSISSLPQLLPRRNNYNQDEEAPQFIRRFSGHVNKALFHFPFALQEKQRLFALIGADRKLKIWSLDRAEPLIGSASHNSSSSSSTPPPTKGTLISEFKLEEDIPLDTPTLAWVPRMDADPLRAQRLRAAADELRGSSSSSSLKESGVGGKNGWEQEKEEEEEEENDVWALALFDGKRDAPWIFQ